MIVAEGVAVSRESGTLLHPFSTRLEKGRAGAVIGPNGAGKTTFLRVVAGLLAPSEGTIRVAGVKPDDRNAEFRRSVTGLIGTPPVARDLTLHEHLMMIAATWGETIPGARQKADSLLEELEIAQFRNRFPHELSSGQSQLAALALVLARPCELLLLDEPEQRLDPERLENVGRVLRARVEDGLTLLLATHSVSLREAVADDLLRVPVAEEEPAHGES
ncbi:ABC transporter ATP-binding protein [Dermabacteraceae bacterium P13115]